MELGHWIGVEGYSGILFVLSAKDTSDPILNLLHAGQEICPLHVRYIRITGR